VASDDSRFVTAPDFQVEAGIFEARSSPGSRHPLDPGREPGHGLVSAGRTVWYMADSTSSGRIGQLR